MVLDEGSDHQDIKNCIFLRTFMINYLTFSCADEICFTQISLMKYKHYDRTLEKETLSNLARYVGILGYTCLLAQW